jgi:hypothetical protein
MIIRYENITPIHGRATETLAVRPSANKRRTFPIYLLPTYRSQNSGFYFSICLIPGNHSDLPDFRYNQNRPYERQHLKSLQMCAHVASPFRHQLGAFLNPSQILRNASAFFSQVSLASISLGFFPCPNFEIASAPRIALSHSSVDDAVTT